MALKDSFVNLNKALRTTLQNVPAVVDTLIRGFDDVADAAEDQITYSTTERVVGKWIDGSDIYEKTIDIGTLPDATGKTVSISNLNVKDIIDIRGTAKSGTTTLALPYVYPATSQINIATVTRIATNLQITTNLDLSTYSGIVTIRYTKATASRSPENDTRNGGDDEPVVKTVDDVVDAPAEELKK